MTTLALHRALMEVSEGLRLTRVAVLVESRCCSDPTTELEQCRVFDARCNSIPLEKSGAACDDGRWQESWSEHEVKKAVLWTHLTPYVIRRNSSRDNGVCSSTSSVSCHNLPLPPYELSSVHSSEMARSVCHHGQSSHTASLAAG